MIRSTVRRARARWLKASLRATVLGAVVWLLVMSGATPMVLHGLPSGGHDWPGAAAGLIAGMATGG